MPAVEGEPAQVTCEDGFVILMNNCLRRLVMAYNLCSDIERFSVAALGSGRL